MVEQEQPKPFNKLSFGHLTARNRVIGMAYTALALTNSGLAQMEQTPSKADSPTKIKRKKNSIDFELVFPENNPDLPPNTVGLKVNHLPKGARIEIGSLQTGFEQKL